MTHRKRLNEGEMGIGINTLLKDSRVPSTSRLKDFGKKNCYQLQQVLSRRGRVSSAGTVVAKGKGGGRVELKCPAVSLLRPPTISAAGASRQPNPAGSLG